MVYITAYRATVKRCWLTLRILHRSKRRRTTLHRYRYAESWRQVGESSPVTQPSCTQHSHQHRSVTQPSCTQHSHQHRSVAQPSCTQHSHRHRCGDTLQNLPIKMLHDSCLNDSVLSVSRKRCQISVSQMTDGKDGTKNTNSRIIAKSMAVSHSLHTTLEILMFWEWIAHNILLSYGSLPKQHPLASH